MAVTTKVLRASGGWRPGMLFNGVQCTGQPLTENHLAQNVTEPSGLAQRESQEPPSPALPPAPKAASHLSFTTARGRPG